MLGMVRCVVVPFPDVREGIIASMWVAPGTRLPIEVRPGAPPQAGIPRTGRYIHTMISKMETKMNIAKGNLRHRDNIGYFK